MVFTRIIDCYAVTCTCYIGSIFFFLCSFGMMQKLYRLFSGLIMLNGLEIAYTGGRHD